MLIYLWQKIAYWWYIWFGQPVLPLLFLEWPQLIPFLPLLLTELHFRIDVTSQCVPTGHQRFTYFYFACWKHRTFITVRNIKCAVTLHPFSKWDKVELLHCCYYNQGQNKSRIWAPVIRIEMAMWLVNNIHIVV